MTPDECWAGLSPEAQERFALLASPILRDTRYLTQKAYVAHGSISVYEHCVSVARQAFALNLAWHAGADERELVRAALLHDYYLYDWHEPHGRLHGFRHPAIAADNAIRDFGVDARIETAIRTHMWPLTITKVPRTRCAWLITIADKQCSLHETLFKR